MHIAPTDVWTRTTPLMVSVMYANKEDDFQEVHSQREEDYD